MSAKLNLGNGGRELTYHVCRDRKWDKGGLCD